MLSKVKHLWIQICVVSLVSIYKSAIIAKVCMEGLNKIFHHARKLPNHNFRLRQFGRGKYISKYDKKITYYVPKAHILLFFFGPNFEFLSLKFVSKLLQALVKLGSLFSIIANLVEENQILVFHRHLFVRIVQVNSLNKCNY